MRYNASLKQQRQTLGGAAILIMLAGTVFAQAPASSRRLEASDIHVAATGEWISLGILPNGWVRTRNASLRKLVAVAYGLPDSIVTGGPSWVDSDRFDIVARLTPSPRDSVLLRLRTILADRFKLNVRHVTMHDTVYALTIASGGSKLQRSATTDDPSCDLVPGVPRQLHVGCGSYGMADLATLLPRIAGGYIAYPVVDRTGLAGAYDFQLHWMAKGAHDAAVAAAAAGAPADTLALSIFDALGRLGLALEKRDIPSDALVIVSATRPPLTKSSPLGASGLTSEQRASVDRYVAAEMKRNHVPGLAVGVYRRGEILLAKGYGLANVELNVPVRPQTIFQSGSVGKQFVSAAVMMLVEEGKIRLDQSIVTYYPDAPDWWRPILVRNLLSHTSGLAEYETPQRAGKKGAFYLRLDFTEDELVKRIEALPMEAKPGDVWNYRNTNYVSCSAS
jgi:uncharacterized protein (TIGR03435 family)